MYALWHIRRMMSCPRARGRGSKSRASLRSPCSMQPPPFPPNCYYYYYYYYYYCCCCYYYQHNRAHNDGNR